MKITFTGFLPQSYQYRSSFFFSFGFIGAQRLLILNMNLFSERDVSLFHMSIMLQELLQVARIVA